MSRRLWLFSSNLERNAAFPDGTPDGLLTGITGVGLVEAAIGTLRMIAIDEPDEIVYLGTCGAYPGSRLEIEEIISGSVVRIGSGDTLTKKMRLPGPLPSELQCDSELSGRIVDVKEASVVCTLGITEESELAKILSRLGDVENLELFAVLCAAGTIPVAGFLGVTNYVGESGEKEWKENYRSVMSSLVESVNPS
ncbi:MAG: hypothetical protein J4G05_11865 [Chlorobi bacterium]|nr:hypothetical protein [Chlorobiota bacterium]